MERQDNWKTVGSQNRSLIAELKDPASLDGKLLVKLLNSLRLAASMREHEEELWGLKSPMRSGESLTSASNTILFPSGHMTWST